VLDEYAWATAAGRGALAVQGKMIDAASLRMARMIVERADAVRARET
jgi:citrate lyase beta subunit